MNVDYLLAATLALAASFGSAVAAETSPAPATVRGGIRTAVGVPDRSVYAGIAPETNKPLYTTLADAPGYYNWSEGADYCAALETDGHQDWHVPTKGELNVIYNNRATIGGFDTSGSGTTGWYWSSSQDSHYGVWGQRFSDGYQLDNLNKTNVLSLRCVR